MNIPSADNNPTAVASVITPSVTESSSLLIVSKNGLAFSANPDKLLPISGRVLVAPAAKPPIIPPINLPIALPTSSSNSPPSPTNHLTPGIVAIPPSTINIAISSPINKANLANAAMAAGISGLIAIRTTKKPVNRPAPIIA